MNIELFYKSQDSTTDWNEKFIGNKEIFKELRDENKYLKQKIREMEHNMEGEHGKIIPYLTKEEREQQNQIICALGVEEILSQLSEECCELAQAAQKMRRVLHGTTPVSQELAMLSLNEEAGDVLLLLDYLERIGYINMETVVKSAKIKNKRWYWRTVG